MMSSSIPHCPVKFCSSGGGTASELVGRPSLMLPPSFVEEGGIRKLEYNFYSPLKKFNRDHNFSSPPLKKKQERVRFDNRSKQDLVRFDNRGDEEVVSLMQDKDTNWVGSSHGWLVLFTKYYNMYLINPLSGRRIHLPRLHGGGEEAEEEEHRSPLKVILSHSPNNKHCRAIAIHGSSDGAASCLRGEEMWAPLAGSRFNDFVYSASRRAFVSAKRVSYSRWKMIDADELEFWDPSSKTGAPVKTVRVPPMSWWDSTWRTYLVLEEESGQLYMVRRYKVGTTRVGYHVFGIDDYFGREVVQLRELLDDLVMFIGVNHCFAVKASRFPEYRANCIYFSGIWFKHNEYADIYDYNNKEYSPLFELSPHNWPCYNMLPWFTLTDD